MAARLLSADRSVSICVSTLSEKALGKSCALAQDKQSAIASQILASTADEGAWRARFAEKQMAREAIEEDELRETLPTDDV